MRLTLRTLLACLDRVLPPEEQVELDAKVAASPPAQQLAARIRRVVAQPGIPAPRPEGRGLAADANSVAEYLDNCLDAERLETFERICLESDMHLAEVAACHDLLAALAREPAAIEPLDPAGRRKLLAVLGRKSASPAEENAKREAIENARAVHAALDRAAPDHPGGAESRTMPAKRRATWPAWALALVAVALLVALGGLLVGAIGRGKARPTQRRDGPAVAVVEPQPKPDPEPEPRIAAPPDGEPAAEPAAVAPPAAAVAEPSAPPAADVPAAAPVAATPAPPAPAAMTPRVPQGDALAIAAPPASAPATPALPASPAVPPPWEAAAPAPPPGPGAESIGVVGGEGWVVRRATAAGKPVWQAAMAGTPLAAREDLVAAFGTRPEIVVRGVSLRLFPGTRVVVSADPDGQPRLEVVFGRVLVRGTRPDARLGIAAAGIVGTVTAGLSDPLAIAVDLDRAAGTDPDLDPARVRASVMPVAGGIAWRQAAAPGVGGLEGIAAEGALESRTAMTWESAAPGVGRVTRLDAVPNWAAGPPPLDRLERAAAEALARRLADSGSLDDALRDLAADRRVENRMSAAATLALLGDYGAAVDLLCDDAPGRRLEQRQWAKLEGDVVPLALARGANAAGRLRQAFAEHGPPGKAEILFGMARGLSDGEVAAGGDEALVEALEDADLVVRRYAFKCLCDIVQPAAADRLRYRPDGLPDLRREGAAWWRGQLQKGLIRRPGAA